MTDEEIKKLSEDCALFYQGRPSNKGYELSNRLTIESYANMVLKWLSGKFCIVPKSKLQEIYHQLKLELGDGGCSEYQDDINMEKESLLKDIFGKSLFEEDKE